MPVRKIPPNRRSMTGRLVCHRLGCSLDYESQLEKDCLLLFSADPAVASIEVQPVRILYRHVDARGHLRVRKYTPDILVSFHPRLRRPPLLVEVKLRAVLETKLEELMPKIRAGIGYARQRDWRFKVYTEKRIQQDNRILLRNIKYLRPRLREPRDSAASRLLLSAVFNQGRTTAAALLEECGGTDVEQVRRLIPCLWRLIAACEINADLSSRFLSFDTPIWPGDSPGLAEK